MDQVQQENKIEEQKIQEQVSTPRTEVPNPEPVETDQEKNWKKFREARDLERKKAEEIAKKAAEKEAEVLALRAAMESLVNKPSNHFVDTNQYEEETEDQRIEKKVMALLQQKEAEAEQKRKQQELVEYPQKLRSIHKDFDQAIAPSNLDYLDYHHPELAKSLGSQPESFEKWNDIYHAVKRYVPNIDTRKEQNKLDTNLQKPKSLSGTGVTQGGNAMPAARLDEARKAANWERMQRSLKGLS